MPLMGALPLLPAHLWADRPSHGLLDLADDLNEKEGVYTVLHEVLHGIWYHRAMPPRPREERVVTELAWGLTAVFRDNPGLLTHLEGLLTESR